MNYWRTRPPLGGFFFDDVDDRMPYFGKRKGAAIARHPNPETYRRSAITNEPSDFAQIPIRAPPLSQLVLQKYNKNPIYDRPRIKFRIM